MELHDHHVHTSLCNHASGRMIEYVKSAIRAGLQSIGFSDHNPLQQEYENRFRMTDRQMDVYFQGISLLREKYGEKIQIKMGIELDFLSEAERYLQEFVFNYPFDFVIGSVHYLPYKNGRYVYLNEMNSSARTDNFKKYFEKIEEAADSGLFDIVAHFDLPKKFWGHLNEEEYELARKALEKIKDKNLALEFNTSGLRTAGLNEPFPGQTILKMVREMGIPIVLGSDSHAPEEVGSNFSQAIEILKNAGIFYIVKFEKRKRVHISIS